MEPEIGWNSLKRKLAIKGKWPSREGPMMPKRVWNLKEGQGATEFKFHVGEEPVVSERAWSPVMGQAFLKGIWHPTRGARVWSPRENGAIQRDTERSTQFFTPRETT